MKRGIGPWLRLAAGAPRHDRIAQLPSDAVRWSWVLALCEGKLQSPGGAWQSWRHLRECMRGRPSSHLDALVHTGLLEKLAGGRFGVRHWQHWQSGPDSNRRRDVSLGPWLRLGAGAPRHRKIAELGSDRRRWAWVEMLCEAKLQMPQGEWRNFPHLRSCLKGRTRPSLKLLFKRGLLEWQGPDRICVHNWDKWQTEPDASHAARQKLYRDRKRERERAVQLNLGVDSSRSRLLSGRHA